MKLYVNNFFYLNKLNREIFNIFRLTIKRNVFFFRDPTVIYF